MKYIGDALVVDHTENAEKIIQDLKKMGLFRSVIEASSGMIGSQKINNQEFILVVVNANLEKNGAFQVLKNLFDGVTIKSSVIVTVDELDEILLKKLLSYGVSKVLLYPYEDETLKELVVSAIKEKATSKKAAV